jgi:hypothetical protein
MARTSALPVDFGSAALRGLSALAPGAADDTDLCLELGLSIWLRSSGTDLASARTTFLHLRALLVEESGLDARTEPIPLLGHAAELDLKNLAVYLGQLVERGAAQAKCDPEVLIEAVIGRLPPPNDLAAGGHTSA